MSITNNHVHGSLTVAVTFPEEKRLKKVVIVGTGYVGMACAIGFAEFGHAIVGVDIDSERVRQLKRGVAPYREAGLDESLRRHLQAGKLDFTGDLGAAVRGADCIIVAVGTPSRPDGSADLAALNGVIDSLTELDLRGSIVALRSTVPPGTSGPIADRLRGNADVVYSPEFLREGSAVEDFLNPDRIIIGADSAHAADRFARLFDSLRKPVSITSFVNAELIKGFSNAFLALKISFANEVANMCDAVDGDALEVLSGVGQDKRIGAAYLRPGIGFGGPCFEKDVKSLVHTGALVDSNPLLLKAVLDVNGAQPTRIEAVLEAELGDLRGLHVGVWGLAFKSGTSDVRDSLAIRVVENLVARGARVVAYDPAVSGPSDAIPCEVVTSPLEAATADVLVVLTDWPSFRDVDAWAIAKRVRRNLVVDGRNVLDPDSIAAAGLTYRGIGRRRLPEDVVSLAQVV